MQRVPGPAGTPTVHTSLALCHAFPDFAQLYARAAARRPQA
jgi:hypothetical protein